MAWGIELKSFFLLFMSKQKDQGCHHFNKYLIICAARLCLPRINIPGGGGIWPANTFNKQCFVFVHHSAVEDAIFRAILNCSGIINLIGSVESI